MAQLLSKLPPLADISQFFGGQFFGKTNIPEHADFTGKTIIITGANGGLGYEAAKHVLSRGVSHLILACRNVSKGEEAKRTMLTDIQHSDQATVEVWEVDLDSYDSIFSFCQRVTSSLPRLDGFIANAGVELIDYEKHQGLERSLMVNVVSTMLQAIGILPKLQETAEKHNADTVLTIVGSMAHAFGPDSELDVPDDTDILTALSDPKTANMAARYPLSKLIVQLCTHELAAKVDEFNKTTAHQVIVNVANPGWCKTDLFRYKSDPLPVRVMLSLVGRTAEEGSRTLVHALTAGPESHGKYLSECQIKPESVFTQSERGTRIQTRLWRELLERLQGISPEITSYVK